MCDLTLWLSVFSQIIFNLLDDFTLRKGEKNEGKKIGGFKSN